ncbi:hypothetical protein M409DRAFT_54933 [Zasmidium cellare ATCC 36951]|uniref:J domain-containing protein n=1 Tax=Zasmidium cellare ATCC 36951 TaxID=1080233 RepID=A0A6A6CJ22_ZASCE|nr:uncharacterized protein M409DRAFT_54933 [Zasmidium cellare ATCC 36951]KAF2166603.1 hypothetical protein M409DRAFT_54933 [Zasmidium cellare ATCC 36951]
MADSMTDAYMAYLQIDHASDPYTILDLSQDDAPTAHEVKAAYRSLALLLHPDKGPSGAFADTHHRLFLKLQQARDDLLSDNSGARDAAAIVKHLVILEGPISLHQRNFDFKARLRNRRVAAIKEEHELAVARTAWKRKSKPASEKPDRAAEKLVAQHGGKITIKQARQAAYNFARKQAEPKAPRQPKTSSNQATLKATKHKKADTIEQQRNSMQETVEQKIKQDPILATPREIAHRRNKELLSGRPNNTSLAEERRRDNTLIAKEFEAEKWIQSQVEPRLAKAVAKMQHRGIFLAAGLIDYENMESKIQQELRDEAKWYFGLDLSEFLGIH